MEPLVENNIVVEKKLGKQIRTFAMNEENPVAKLIIRFYDELTALPKENI
jgi:hypothetical protein